MMKGLGHCSSRNTLGRALKARERSQMVGFWFILGGLALVFAVIGIARLLDRLRGIDSNDKWSGWNHSKTADMSQTGGFKSGEFDSMNDHGSRGQDGGL